MELREILHKHGVLGNYIKTILRRHVAYPNVRLDKILEDFAILVPSTIASIMSDYTNTPLITKAKLDIEKVPISWRKLRPQNTFAVPIFADDNEIHIGVSHPQAEETFSYIHRLHSEFQTHKIRFLIADRNMRNTVFRMFQHDEEEIQKLQQYIHSVEALPEDMQSEDKLNDVIVSIIQTAVSMSASDIQLLATDNFGQVQFKVEGTGHIVGEMTRDLYMRVMRKLITDLNISPDSIRSKSTEASISSESHQHLPDDIFRFFNFRCQFTMPEPKESDYIVATIRLLSRNLDILSFEDAGFTPTQIRHIHHGGDGVAGLVLAVGPVNSGKSTTLFAMLSRIDPVLRLVKTIENPIEFRCPLWEQNALGDTMTLQDEHASYRQHIKGMVRKSPDCLLAGELRSAEEAGEIFGLAYASTLCFSSLHAENVANAIGRMRFWGIPDIDLANVLRLIIAQRLVRQPCPRCKLKETNEDNIREAECYADHSKTTFSKDNLFTENHGGCEFCRYTGYTGRRLIAEMFSLLYEGSEEVLMSGDNNKLRYFIDEKGASLWHSGMRLVLNGDATVNEIVRHTSRHVTI